MNSDVSNAAFSAFFLLAIYLGGLIVWPAIKSEQIGKRKRQSGGWLWGFFLSWIGVWILMAQPDPIEFRVEQDTSVTLAPEKRCGDCAEYVSNDAKVCKFCGKAF